MSYTKIAKIFADSEALSGQTVSVGGWVRTIRRNKYIEHQIECCAGSNQQCAGLV